MRSNRIIRDKIQEGLGAETLREVSKWNDQYTDSFAAHGLEMDPTEERVQQDTLELMATEELIFEELHSDG